MALFCGVKITDLNNDNLTKMVANNNATIKTKQSGETTIIEIMGGDVITKKLQKRKKVYTTETGNHICECGFVITTNNYAQTGKTGLEVRARLHRKVCPNANK